MTPFFRPRAVVVASILAAVAALFYYDSIPPVEGRFFFEVTVSSTAAGMVQLYYDTGRGFRESDSARQTVPAGGAPTVCRFPLPTGTYRALRFDPINHAATVDFSAARIVDQQGNPIRAVGPELFSPRHDIASLTPFAGGLRVIATGEDPFLVLATGDPLVLRAGAIAFRDILLSALVMAGVFFAVLAAGMLSWRPGWPPSRAITVKIDPWLAGATVALVALKLWLASAQTLYGIGGAIHDDQLFVNQAHALLEGRWLGEYSQFTLAKGPMYPLFLAASFLLGVPFFTLLQLLYAAACVVLMQALRPLVPHRGLRFAIFAVLLFNPVTYESLVHARVLRQNLIPGLALLIVAAFIGLYARRAASPRRLVPWAGLAGIALAAFWLTREESVWILPCAGLLWLATAVAMWRSAGPGRHLRLGLLAVPVLLCLLGTGTVAAINLRHYGIFTTCEFKQTEFKDGYGALMRVEPLSWRPYLPVTRESRARIYAVSPAFAELRPYLEGPLGEGWAAASEGVTGLPAREHEMAIGWFMWAVRDAVALAGHCTTGANAMAYYAQLGREVNAACDRGLLLPSGSHRSGFVPPLRRESVKAFFQAWPDIATFFASFAQMHTGRQPSSGEPEQLVMFADLTRERLGPPVQGPPVPPLQRRLDDLRLGLLAKISRCYHVTALWAGAAASLALLAALCLSAVNRRLSFFTVASVGLLGSIVALTVAIALIQVTSFPAVNTGYFSGAYGLWLLFMFTGWLAFVEAWRRDPPPAVGA